MAYQEPAPVTGSRFLWAISYLHSHPRGQGRDVPCRGGLLMDEEMMAACGLDCKGCAIRRAPEDPEAAEELIRWLKALKLLAPGEGLAEVIEKKMYCRGCLADRSLHWSPDCWILICCVDTRGHENCSQCEEFPCRRLEEWAGGDEGYGKALEKLKRLR